MLTSRRVQDENSNFGTSGKFQDNPASTGKFGRKSGAKNHRKVSTKYELPAGVKNSLLGNAAPRKALGDITNATPVISTSQE